MAASRNFATNTEGTYEFGSDFLPRIAQMIADSDQCILTTNFSLISTNWLRKNFAGRRCEQHSFFQLVHISIICVIRGKMIPRLVLISVH
jgi:hypothetical protein